MQKCVQLLLLLMLAPVMVGCSATAPIDQPRKPIPLVQVNAFAAEHREAARMVAASLADNGESAEEFYAEVEPKAGGRILLFHLWHESAFEPRNRDAPGNPGGKCRDVQYDVRQRKVTQSLFWQ